MLSIFILGDDKHRTICSLAYHLHSWTPIVSTKCMASIDESPYKKSVYTEIYCICSQTIASIGKCLSQFQRLVAFYDTYIVTYNNLATQAVRRMVPSAWPTQRDNKIDRKLRTRHELNNRASNLVERKHKINGCYTVLE